MSQPLRAPSLPQSVALVLFSAWPLITLMSRQSAPVVAGLMALVLIWAAMAEGRLADLAASARDMLRAPDFWLLVLALGLIFAATRPSPVPKRALLAAGQMTLGLGIGTALLLAAPVLRDETKARASLIAALVGAPALIALIRFWEPLHALFTTRDLITDTNRTAVLLAMLAPVAVYWVGRGSGWIAAVLLGLAITVAVFWSFSESAKLALLVALLVSLLHRLMGRSVIWLVGAVSALIVLAAPLIGLHVFDLVPGWLFRHTEASTFSIRGDIWREFSVLALQKPWFGWGVEASFAPLQGLDRAAFSEAQRKVLEIGHTHNAPLQIWYELGLAGAGLAALLIGAVTVRIARMADAGARGVAFSLASAAYAVSAVSHGAWQVWWYCLVALVAAFAPRSRAG